MNSFDVPISSGRSLAEDQYYGHGRADWTGQVEEAVELMEVGTTRKL